MERRFVDKTIVITGAAGGIGRAAATRFAAEGARLVLVDVNAGGLAETMDAVERAGGRGLVVEADVTRLGEVQRYVAAALERWGGIDAFFNNAGILGVVSPLVDYPETTFDRVIAVNVKSVWLGLKVVAPAMIARGGGVIVNTASIAGLRGSPNLVAYTASKHAVIGLTRTADRAGAAGRAGERGMPGPHRDGDDGRPRGRLQSEGSAGPPTTGSPPPFPCAGTASRRRWRRWWPS